jgi:nitroreductase
MTTAPSGASAVAGSDTALTAAEAAVARRSVRAYNATPVTDDEIRSLLELTGRAPSAYNVQPWRFIVVRDQALKDQLRAAAYNQPQVSNAPAVIAMYSDMDDVMAKLEEVVHPGLDAEKREGTLGMLRNTFGGMAPENRNTWGNAQANIALGYLLLLAKSEGFDTSPMLGFQADQVKALLGIPASATVTALVAIGRGTDSGFPSHRHPVERIAIFK